MRQSRLGPFRVLVCYHFARLLIQRCHIEPVKQLRYAPEAVPRHNDRPRPAPCADQAITVSGHSKIFVPGGTKILE
ncbi:MAG: hypothetical protein NZ739_12100, partial [Verrucomicrobiae bacterium]|nr:hypothetical protein [Verrucomicrobiae bacterium]